jgi:hypothetical protein
MWPLLFFGSQSGDHLVEDYLAKLINFGCKWIFFKLINTRILFIFLATPRVFIQLPACKCGKALSWIPVRNLSWYQCQRENWFLAIGAFQSGKISQLPFDIGCERYHCRRHNWTFRDMLGGNFATLFTFNGIIELSLEGSVRKFHNSLCCTIPCYTCFLVYSWT